MRLLRLAELRPAEATCAGRVVKLVVRFAEDVAKNSSCRVRGENCVHHSVQLEVLAPLRTEWISSQRAKVLQNGRETRGLPQAALTTEVVGARGPTRLAGAV
jgi:hypothetical protein